MESGNCDNCSELLRGTKWDTKLSAKFQVCGQFPTNGRGCFCESAGYRRGWFHVVEPRAGKVAIHGHFEHQNVPHAVLNSGEMSKKKASVLM